MTSNVTLSDIAIGEFFDGLKSANDGPAGRAVAAARLSNHRDEIEAYVKRYEDSPRYRDRKWGKRLRKLVKRHCTPPKGFYYDEGTGVLHTTRAGASHAVIRRNARATARSTGKHSRAYAIARLIASGVLHILKLGIVAMLIWAAWEMLHAAGEICGDHVTRLERLLYEAEMGNL